MDSRLTQFDRTFRYAGAYRAQDAREVLAQYEVAARVATKPSDVPGMVCAAFAAGQVGTHLNKLRAGNGTARDVQILENRTHYVAMRAFAEYMRRQSHPRCYPDLIPAFDTYVGLMKEYVDHGADEDLNTTIQMYFQQAAFLLASQPVYEVSPGLALELLDTELRGLSQDDLQLPFETIYIHAPTGTGLKVYNADSDWHDIDGMYITEDVDDDGLRTWKFLLVGLPKPIPREIDGYGPVEFDNDALLHWRFEFRHDSLEECIAETERGMMEQTESETFKKIIPVWRELFRFAMNTILYATMPDADVERIITDEDARRLFARTQRLPKGSKKKARLLDRLKGMDTSTRYQLGRTIRIDRMVAEARAHLKSPTGRALSIQFRRTGHFRNQPYGEGRQLRKRIWIKPCWVGGKDKPLSMPRRRLEKPEDAPYVPAARR